MKPIHIIGILVIAVAIFIVISTAGDASTYVSFGEAKTMAESGNNKMIHVVGELTKDESGEVVGIEPSEDKLAFSFQMVDNNGFIQKVYYNEPMPQDFQRSEQVVIIGSYKEDVFLANKILLKCPSKYQEETIDVKQVNN